MVPLPPLASPRLLLEPLTLAHVDAAHALWTEPAVRRYLWDDEVIPRARAAAALEASEADFVNDGFGLWGLRLVPQSALIGFSGLRRGDLMPEPELLFGLSQPHWGHGLATESAQAVLRYAFHDVRLPAVGAATDVPNVRSARVLERLGMRLLRRADVHGRDTLFYRLAADGWVASAARTSR